MRKYVLLLLLAPFFLAACGTSIPAGYTPQEGDLVFQALPRSAPLVDAIEGCTDSPYSHVGIVTKVNNQWHILEAIGPVQEIPLGNYIARGRRDAIVVYRLKDPAPIPAMITAARKDLGKPYDIKYEFDDPKIYCSELIFRAYKSATGQQLGQVQKLGDLNWKPHEEFIRSMENGKLPLTREMITPRAMSESPLLEKVYSDPMPKPKED